MMNFKYLYLLLLLIISSFRLQAQSEGQFNPDSTFYMARQLAFDGKREEARDSLQKILEKYPNHLDAKLLTAKTLSWDKSYDKARRHFNELTSIEKYNQELWLATIKNELYAERYHLVLGLANKALDYLPEDEAIKSLRKNAVKKIEGAQEIYEELKKENSSLSVENAIAVQTGVQAFDKYFQPFYNTTIEYQRNTKIGAVLPRLTYANRFDLEGTQLELDFYPRISKKLHGYFNYGYSNAAIFPNHRIGGEVYMQLPKAMETSMGLRYLNFDDQQVFIYTGSYGLYSGNYYFSLRPYVSYAEGDLGFSGSLVGRKYLKNAQNFLGLNLSYGINAENNQFFNGDRLLAESLIYLSSLNLNFSYQFTGKNNLGSFQTSLNLTKQEVPFLPNEFVHSATIGLQYKFNF